MYEYYNNVFLFVGLTKLGTLNFDWLVPLVGCRNVSITNCNLQKGNFVNDHFIGHFLIPLDP